MTYVAGVQGTNETNGESDTAGIREDVTDEDRIPHRDARGADAVTRIDCSAVVMGLHWAPASQESGPDHHAPDLNAVCLLLDAAQRPLEIVEPRRPRNANGSVMHTGDSRDGASVWDDERVFAFLDALPQQVHTLAFGVVSVSGHAFGDVAGASCHISDHVTDDALVRIDLTALGGTTQYCVATLQRGEGGWLFGREPHALVGYSAMLKKALD